MLFYILMILSAICPVYFILVTTILIIRTFNDTDYDYDYMFPWVKLNNKPLIERNDNMFEHFNRVVGLEAIIPVGEACIFCGVTYIVCDYCDGDVYLVRPERWNNKSKHCPTQVLTEIKNIRPLSNGGELTVIY